MAQIFIPVAREQVHILGRAGLFFVLTVDHESRLAFVVRVDDDRDGDSGMETIGFDRLIKPNGEAMPENS